jgi:hypothetical protein
MLITTTIAITLTTANAVALDDFGTKKLDPILPMPTSYALAGYVHPGADVPRLHRPGTEHLSKHLPAICQPVSGGISGHRSVVRPERRAVHPAGDPDVHLPELVRVPRKRESW